MDAAIGEVVALLETNGMMENTVVIFTSDNGGQAMSGASNYPYRGNKSFFYEGGKNSFQTLNFHMDSEKLCTRYPQNYVPILSKPGTRYLRNHVPSARNNVHCSLETLLFHQKIDKNIGTTHQCLKIKVKSLTFCDKIYVVFIFNTKVETCCAKLKRQGLHLNF